MIFCKELNKEFNTKSEMFKALIDNKDTILTSKKAQVFKSCDKGISVNAKPIDSLKFGSQIKELKIDSDYYYIAVNTTRILDNHTDLHLDGIWNKTVKEQQGKVYLVFGHDMDPTKTIVRKEHIEMFVVKIPFSLLGKSYEGETEALIYKFRKDKVVNQTAKEWLDSGDEIEASVRMRYVDISFALNSDKEENKEFKKNFEKYLPLIANKEDFEEIDYFYPVRQAQNLFESSLVLFGSNSTTGQIINNDTKLNKEEKHIEPLKDTQKEIEPSKTDTQKEIYKYLINNLKKS